MNPIEPLEVEKLVSTDSRRVTRESISRPCNRWDDLDLEIDAHLQADPFNGDPPSKRKDREVARVLSILDALEERGNG